MGNRNQKQKASRQAREAANTPLADFQEGRKAAPEKYLNDFEPANIFVFMLVYLHS